MTMRYQGGSTPSLKGESDGTTYFQETIGITKEGNVSCLKGKSGARLLYVKLKSRQVFHFTTWDLGQ